MNLRDISLGLTVNDVEASLAWYRDVLGFTAKERWEQDGKLLGVEMHGGNALIMLGQDDWKKGRDRVKGEGVRIYFTTEEDIDQIAADIKSRGGALAQAEGSAVGHARHRPRGSGRVQAHDRPRQQVAGIAITDSVSPSTTGPGCRR